MAKPLYSRRALASLQGIHVYLSPLNANAAARVIKEVDAQCRLIAEFPMIGRAIPDTSLRYLVTRRYRYPIIYRIRGKTVEIRDVLHPSRR